MGRRKKKDIEKDSLIKSGSLNEETVSWILAIAFFVISIFFILASLDKGGRVGIFVFDIFSSLFGLGYFLIPIVFIILGISFAKSIKRSVSISKFGGAVLFFVSSLALLDFAFSQMSMLKKGGIVGSILQKPLVKMFDVYATPIILLGLLVISILIIFNTSINIESLAGIFGRKKIEEEDNDDDTKLIVSPPQETKIEQKKSSRRRLK